MKERCIIIKLKIRVNNSETLLNSMVQILKENIKNIVDKISQHIGISMECTLIDKDC